MASDDSAEMPLVDIDDVYRAIGAVVATSTRVELGLASAVSSLSRSPLTAVIVQGERGSTLIRMARRLLQQGVGSTSDDEASGRTDRWSLISPEDTTQFLTVLSAAEQCLGQRDAVAHSLWLANMEPGVIHGQRTTRSSSHTRAWTLAELERLRQDLLNVAVDLHISQWNSSGSGMARLPQRLRDAT